MPRTVKMQKNRVDSVIGSPGFAKWVRSFDFKDPSFLKMVDKRDVKSERWIADLRHRMIVSEREYQNVRVNV